MEETLKIQQMIKNQTTGNNLESIDLSDENDTRQNIIKKRIAICKSCSSLRLNFCKECNCYMPFKVKIISKNINCPVGKW